MKNLLFKGLALAYIVFGADFISACWMSVRQDALTASEVVATYESLALGIVMMIAGSVIMAFIAMKEEHPKRRQQL